MLELPMKNDTSHKIIHVDMDAFYASIEERDDPRLRSRALVIAHDPRTTGGKGVVTTANYVARQFGVHSAMPANQALRLVPRRLLTFKAPDFTKYRAVSAQIHALFHQVTDLIEPVALDEAYLDVTGNTQFRTTIALGLWLQDQIRQATGLTSSIGLSYNKFLAKEASEYNKPQGRTIILPEQAQEFLDRLPIAAFRGVGAKTAPQLEAMGITDGYTLRQFSQEALITRFGKMGLGLYQHARGVDNRPVLVRTAKSIGKERTYQSVLAAEPAVKRELERLAELVAESLTKKQKHGKTVVLKVRDADFVTQTKRLTQDTYFQGATAIAAAAWQLWQGLDHRPEQVRLLGITLTALDPQQYENIDLQL
ncbi:DNA polymerase IV [Lacticaseibacillus parakribbianus]|uniref:DNA polymerase IV n=1 Tax=Lacticaseibacillus parakribbianus TaxID=2970927 RepID=UPI0021CB8F77|nr:DNA polymerase IV [Lacticaseibacillus parakribbianus]